jgi:hypothetical protein
LLADLDGDGKPEIVFGDGGGKVHAYRSDGTILAGFPYDFGGEISHGLAVWDIDGDGTANLVIQGDQRLEVHALDLGPGTFDRTDAGSRPWPQFRHDVRNLGRIDRSPFTKLQAHSVTESARATAVLAFAVRPATPNPSLDRVLCAFDLPRTAAVAVGIVSPSGRRIRSLLQSDALGAGSHEVDWDGRDDRGRRASAGVYFLEVRAAGLGVRTGKITLLD